MEYASQFDTQMGRGVVVASDLGLRHVYLPGEATGELIARGGLDTLPSSGLTERVARMLMQYFKGERQPFDLIPLDLAMNGGFRRRILDSIRSIPFGEVRSYAEVAAAAGSPKAARAVGGAMASNPVPVVVPCHRVVAGNGGLTGYSAEGGVSLKKYLLQMEGVEFKGEIACKKIIGYKQADLA